MPGQIDRSKWLDPRFVLTLVLLIGGGIASYAIASYRIDILEQRADRIEKKTEVLTEINANLRFISESLGKLETQVRGIVDRELSRSNRP